jgi:hypothetical protein
MNTGMTIGKLAEAAGVNVETIRYYQALGKLVQQCAAPRTPPPHQRNSFPPYR